MFLCMMQSICIYRRCCGYVTTTVANDLSIFFFFTVLNIFGDKKKRKKQKKNFLFLFSFFFFFHRFIFVKRKWKEKKKIFFFTFSLKGKENLTKKQRSMSNILKLNVINKYIALTNLY